MYQPKFLIISLPFQMHPCDVSQGSSFLCVFLPRKTTGFSGNYFLFKSKVFSFLRSLLYSTLFPRYYKSRKRNRLLLRKIYNNEESTLLGYSVAFGSTGCSGSAGGRAPFAPLARTLSGTTNSWGGGGLSGACPPGKFVKLDSLKCNFLRSLDRNWVTGIMTGIISFFRLYTLHNKVSKIRVKSFFG